VPFARQKLRRGDIHSAAPKPYTDNVNGPLLIAGSGVELITALSSQAEKCGVAAAQAIIPKRNARGDAADKGSSLFDWNPGSAISTRGLVLAAENRLGALGGGIIVCAAPHNASEYDFSPTGIDFLVDNHVKSYMFLAQELTRYFYAAQSGTLALVMLEEADAGLLAAPIFGAFKSFAAGLLEHTSEYIRAAAFSCKEKPPAPVNEFASYIVKTLVKDEKFDGGRWFKFTRLMHNLKLS
jgi:hypothetical protein